MWPISDVILMEIVTTYVVRPDLLKPPLWLMAIWYLFKVALTRTACGTVWYICQFDHLVLILMACHQVYVNHFSRFPFAFFSAHLLLSLHMFFSSCIYRYLEFVFFFFSEMCINIFCENKNKWISSYFYLQKCSILS